MSEKGTESIQSPLGKVKGLGAAHNGVTHWWHQRITAITNIPLMLWLVWSVVHIPAWTHQEFVIWLEQPVNSILMILSILSVFYHAALGCQVIVEDYFHVEWMKITKLIGIKLFFFALTVTCIFSVLKISFGV